MRCGAIVMSSKDNAQLFRIKGIINGKEGKKIAILEEVCNCSTKAKFAYLDSLDLVWSPKSLTDIVEEYDISAIDEDILIDEMNNCQ